MAARPLTNLLDKRLVFVTGKGGVGKSTVALALAMVGARSGRRTILCEVAQQERTSKLFHREGVGPREAELAPNLAAISIDPQQALDEYLRHQVGSRRLAALLFENRIFQYFAAAAPGVKELVTMGKVWELAQLERPWASASTRYDLVVVDSPATGHGLGLLRVPGTIREIARVGPIRRQADRIDRFVRDSRRTGVVAVALAEEMPITETLELRQRLRDEMAMELDAVIVNAVFPERFSSAEARALAAAERTDGVSERGSAAIAAALSEHGRARAQRAQLRRLRKEVEDAVTLPYVFAPEVQLESVRELSLELARRLDRATPAPAAGA